MSNPWIYKNYQIILSLSTPILVTIFVSAHNILQQVIVPYVSLLNNHIPFDHSLVSRPSVPGWFFSARFSDNDKL